jgi:hypothetical protein
MASWPLVYVNGTLMLTSMVMLGWGETACDAFRQQQQPQQQQQQQQGPE